ncbi:MAG: MATE family efflux transporter [Anaerolineaceae bacterium]|nr:MATE family efflux transporter [Anaerolineaceae bacterium]
MTSEKKTVIEGRGAALETLVKLALPAVLQQLLSSLLQYVDTAMVGHLGEAATASVSTSTSVNWLVHSLPYGFTIGLLSLISQAYGRGDREEIRRLSAMCCRIVISFGLILTVLCLGISPFLPIWMQSAPEIRKAASDYFFIVSVPLIFFVANSAFASAMQAIKDTRTPMIINVSSNILNVFLNWLLIYRFSLGTYGAALATAISTSVGGIGMFLAFRRKKELAFPLREVFRPAKDLFLRVASIAYPVMGTSVISCMGYIVFAGMVSGMGVTIFAAHSIAITAEEIFYLPGYGIRTATSALIGIAIGEKNTQKFRDVRSVSLRLTVLLMLLNGLILFLTAHPLMRIFTNSEEVAVMGAQVLRLVAFSELFFGLMVAWEGISYGTGHTRAVFVIEALSMWGVRILCTWLVIRAGYGLKAVWYCMIADNVTKAVALTLWGMRQRNEVTQMKKAEL